MVLLRTSDLRLLPANSGQESVLAEAMRPAEGGASFLVGKHGVDLATLLPLLEPERLYPLMTRGGWSLHEMILYCQSLVGPCNAWITSWGISQEPLQQIINAKRDGRFLKLNCLFDVRVRTECPQAFQLTLHDDVVVKLGKNHSKVTVLLNDQHAVTISASANLTVNPRMEHYFISTHRSVAQDTMRIVSLEMDDALPFSAE